MRNDDFPRLPRELGSDGWVRFIEGEMEGTWRRRGGLRHTWRERKGGTQSK